MLTLSTVSTVSTDDERESRRLDVLNPSTRIETQFGTDRAVWRLLSLQNRLKQAKSPETRAAIVQAIQDHIRTMALLYTDVHTEGYRSGVEFGKQNASFYHNAAMIQRQMPHRRVEVRTVDRRPVMVVNGRSID
ncbi:hypothetical protein H6F89_03500 [Cyanobacteria bacterium FACHB-63]|nr:hypothetical protein [Cyanobacteria bacterium FACHB-63]